MTTGALHAFTCWMLKKSGKVTHQLGVIFLCLMCFHACAKEDDLGEDDAVSSSKVEYQVVYRIAPIPKKELAKVDIHIENAELLRWLRFSVDSDYHRNFVGNGKLRVEGEEVYWEPPKKNAHLTYDVLINRPRKSSSSEKSFDAFMAESWAIFRGDDVIPSARVRSVAGARSKARLVFDLPEEWPSVNTGWPKADGEKEPNAYVIDNPDRRFDRPTGWFVMGDLGTRRAKLGDTSVGVSAPKASDVRRMDILTMLTFVWPQVEKTFPKLPQKLLIVGAGEPMWRGGLSSPNSFYLHQDRPLVSENGTSTVLHELFHVVSRLSGGKDSDWVAEGLAEYYAIEWLHRAGGMTKARRESVYEGLKKWAKEESTLIGKRSSGAKTAKAALYFLDIDTKLKQLQPVKNLDDFIRPFQYERSLTAKDIMQRCDDFEIICTPIK